MSVVAATVTVFAILLALAAFISDAIDNWRAWRRERRQRDRERLPDNQPVRVDRGAEILDLDTLRGQLAMKTDERAVFTREGGFALKPKRKKKHGRKWKHR